MFNLSRRIYCCWDVEVADGLYVARVILLWGTGGGANKVSTVDMRAYTCVGFEV
jgi:hypothetical protein